MMIKNIDIFATIGNFYAWGIQINKEDRQAISNQFKQVGIVGIKRLLLEYFAVGGLWFNCFPFMLDEIDLTDILLGWIFSFVLYILVFLCLFFTVGFLSAVITVLIVHIICVIFGLSITRRLNFV